MKLISCNGCGVILDHDKLGFAKDIWEDSGCIDERKADFCQHTKEWTAFVLCPVCEEKVFYEGN